MEIRMTVHVPRRRPAPVDVVIHGHGDATAGGLRAALATHLRMPVAALAVAGESLPDESRLGYPPLLDGVSVAVLGAPGASDPVAGGAGARPRPVLSLVCVGGPDAGRSHPLEPPGFEVGRSPQHGLRLADPSLSRAHARIDVGADGVFVTDLGSTNGVRVDGEVIDARVAIDTGSTVVIGASTLRLRRAPGPGTPVAHPGDGTVLVAPGQALAPDVPEVRVEAPPPPPEPPRGRIPWVAALAPVPVVAVLAVVLGPQLLAFALVGPIALLTTGLADRVGGRRRRRRDLADHAAAVAAARRRFADALALECRVRHLAHPDPDEVLRRAEHRLPGLWSGPDDRTVRVGLGDVPSRALWTQDGEAAPGTARHVPVLVDLDVLRCLAVLGAPARTGPVLGAILGQLLVRSSPARLRLRHHGVASSAWSDLVPHATGSGRPVLVLEDAAGVPEAAALVQEALDAGGVAVLAACSSDDLPAGCAAVLQTTAGGRGVLRTPGQEADLVVDAVSAGWQDRLARALAPLRASCSAGGRLPGTVDLPDLEPVPLTTEGVLARWADGRGPVAAVGVDAAGVHVIDLVADGPHLLVGGTTGSGKSEFLRTLVTGLALGSSPADVTVLLVDFKGGAAFGPCAGLPHVVGLVTDLDDHLMGRVLRSLAAEVRRREQLLADVGASDFADYRSRPGAPPLPRLVVVVDELRTLVDELPDFVTGLIRLAAQGRSLGIHLVLATQRPSGAITPEVQANVNLRIAFRVRDRADSLGVVDDAAAAELPPDTPGRAVARGGDGRLTMFQAALVRPAHPDGPSVVIRTRGASGAGDVPAAGSVHGDRATETAAVVEVVAAAHRQRGGEAAQRAWLPPLPGLVGSEALGPGGFGLVDDPDRQRRTSLAWTPSVPVWRVVGAPRTGRSTALRALVVAAAGVLPAGRLHVHVLARAGEYDDLAALAHVGTVARLEDQVAVRALISHLDTAGDRASGADGTPAGPVTTLLVVDGWDRLTDLDGPHDATPLTHELLRVVRDGAAGGLVVAVSGGRELLRSTWSALGGEVLALGALDPLDTALLGLPVGSVAPGGGPGRAVRAADGLEVQLAVPGPADLAALTAAEPPSDGPAPWRYRPLPTRVGREDVRPDRDPPDPPALLLGVAGSSARSWAWTPAVHGRRLLVTGPPGSGRSTALDVLARSAADLGRPVVVVRGARVAPPPGAAGAWPVLRPEQVDALVALRQQHPDLIVLVDDADRLDGSVVLPVLAEVEDLADRDGGAVAVVSATSALRTRFRGLDVDVAGHRLGVLLRPDPADGDVLGVRRLTPTEPAPPGRGVVVAAGVPTPIQVLDPRRGGPPGRAT